MLILSEAVSNLSLPWNCWFFLPSESRSGNKKCNVGLNDKVKSLILNQDHQAIIDYKSPGKEATLAIPTPDHYYTSLYALGLQTKNEKVTIFNDQSVMGSIAIVSIKIDNR